MADLEALGQAHEVSLAELWTWPEERLRKVLSWPTALFKDLSLHRSKWGTCPSVDVPPPSTKVFAALGQSWSNVAVARAFVDMDNIKLQNEGRQAAARIQAAAISKRR